MLRACGAGWEGYGGGGETLPEILSTPPSVPTSRCPAVPTVACLEQDEAALSRLAASAAVLVRLHREDQQRRELQAQVGGTAVTFLD